MAKQKGKSKTKSPAQFSVGGKLWLEGDGEKFFGPGPVELLQHIQDTGSINKAAKAMGMSYKKAWEIIQSLNVTLATPLVITQAGGDKGGGSVISPEAIKLIKYHHELRKRFEAFLETESKKINTNLQF